MERRLAAIFALDMVGFSRLVESDEADTLARQESLRAELIDPAIERHHGRVVKGTGDGLLAEFASAVDAVECAAEVQRAMAEREAETPRDRQIQFRIGINVGDIVVRDGDIFGDGVNVAARIESLADPGGILVSDSAYNQVHSKVKLGFENLGPHPVKNLQRPVQVYRVLLDPAFAGASAGEPTQPPVLTRIWQRRVPQIVGLYLLSSWALLEFVDWGVRQYALSPTISSFVVTLLLLLLPSVAWLAWRHGAPGPDGWSSADFTVTLANLVVAALVLGSTFGGEELGAATTTKVLEDGEGNRVERAVPKESMVRKVQIVGFDNESGDPELDWLSFGIPVAVGRDLGQDAFVRVMGPAEQSGSAVRSLDLEGYAPPYEAVPLSLLRDVAERSGVDRFLAGQFRRNEDTLLVDTRLYDTHNSRIVATRSYRSIEPLEIVDQLSIDLRRDLGVPEWQIEKALDLPVSELVTASPEAFRLYVLALVHCLSYIPRYEACLDGVERALEHDPTSAELLASAGIMSWYFGDQDVALEMLGEAMRRSYKLSERERLYQQAFYQEVVEQDVEGAVRTLEYWAELYPEDPGPWRYLSETLRDAGDREGQIEALREVIAIDPSDPSALSDISVAFIRTRAADSALVYFGLAQDRWPSSSSAYTGAAMLLAATGRLEEARDELKRALLLAPGDGSAERMLFALDLRSGRFAEASGDLARFPRDTESTFNDLWLLASQQFLAYETGRFHRVEELHRQFIDAGMDAGNVLQVVVSAPFFPFLFFAEEGGRGVAALEEIEALRSRVEPPYSHAVDFAAARIHVERDELDEARESLRRVEEMNASLGGELFESIRIDGLRAGIVQLEDGNCERAIALFDKSIEELSVYWQAETIYDPVVARLPVERIGCLRSLGRLEEAEEALVDLINRFPGSAMLRLEAARVYAAQGRTDDAIAELETARETWSEADPEYIPAREARELLVELRAGV